MTWWEVFLLALGLAADAVVVAAGIGLRHRGTRPLFRIAFHFGLFQALFPLLGAFIGTVLLRWVVAWDHWLVFAVLSVLGGRMIVEAWQKREDQRQNVDLTRRWALMGLSIAVSIDAFGAGIGLATAKVSLAFAVVMIGVVTTLMAAMSMHFAGWVRNNIGFKAGYAGGLILLFLAVRFLLTHLHAEGAF
jgi:putative Mn2+ efflux pump MntP